MEPDHVRCAAYGDLFRPRGRKLAVGDLPLRPEDLDLFEQGLLHAWWVEAAQVDAAVIAPDARTGRSRTHRGLRSCSVATTPQDGQPVALSVVSTNSSSSPP